MSAEVLTEIKEKFGGKWKVDRSECFGDFLRATGVNVFVRTMAGLIKPVSDIKVDGEMITVSINAGFMVKSDTYKLGEEFETDNLGNKSKATASYEDGKLVMNAIPSKMNSKPINATREIVDGELILTLSIGDVVCKRYFKRVPA